MSFLHIENQVKLINNITCWLMLIFQLYVSAVNRPAIRGYFQNVIKVMVFYSTHGTERQVFSTKFTELARPKVFLLNM